VTADAPTADELRREIDAAIHLTDTSQVNVAYLALLIIDRADDATKPILLKHLAFEWDDVESTRELTVDTVISAEQLDRLRDEYGGLVDQLLRRLLGRRPSEEDFYIGIWRILSNPELEETQARAFALYWILIDKLVPYFQIEEGLRMSGDDWRSLITQTRAERARIRFILYSNYDQANQRADLLLRELDANSGEPGKRVILMSSILWSLEDDRRRVAGS
jgi:hypothetical protein